MTDYRVLSALAAVGLLSGCAGIIPVSYQPQNFVRYEGRADVAAFTYTPTQDGTIAPNQLENTAAGSIYIGADVAEFVRRATALELEKTGVALNDRSPARVSGDVLRFKLDDFGYSVDWTYCVRYRVARKSDSREVFDSVYMVTKRTGKFGLAADYTPSVNELIVSAYDQFIRDERTRAVLAATAEELATAKPANAPAPPPACVRPTRSAPARTVRCEADSDCDAGAICYQNFCRR